MDKHQQARELIDKYISGQCTPDERAIFESWYNQLTKTQQDLAFEPDYRSRLIQLQSKLNIRQKPIRRLWPRIAAAASVLVCCGIGLYFYEHQTSKPESSTQIVKNDIAPGSNGAILTLANGKKIVLEQAKIGAIASQNGTNLSKAGDSLLIYQTGTPVVHEISYNTLETPRGKQYSVVLPDGTKVWLNAASSLKYPTAFSGVERVVELSGEGYFEVVHNSKMPFRVKTGEEVVEDIGTGFNISAYTDEPQAKATLVSGSIKIRRGNQEKLLKPGEQAIVEANKEEIKIVTADTDAAIAWKNGDFIFKNEDLKTVMRKIARWYNVEVVYDPSANTGHIPGGFISRSKNISAVLKIMESTGKVHFKVEGRRIAVTK